MEDEGREYVLPAVVIWILLCVAGTAILTWVMW